MHCQGHDPDDPDATLTFSWIRNNQDVEDVEPEAAVYLNHTLYIPRVSNASLGAYECVAMDENNVTETSLTATVVEACEYCCTYNKKINNQG